MTAKIYIPALGAIVIFLAVIAGIMVHRHERRVDERMSISHSENQALAANCRALAKEGEPNTNVCKLFYSQNPEYKP